MTPPIHRTLAKGATAAALTLPLLAGGAAVASAGEPETVTIELDRAALDVDTWYGAYTYEELLVVADAWHLGQLEAKARAVAAIEGGDTSEIDAILTAAGPLAPTPALQPADDTSPTGSPDPYAAFWDAGYSYDQLLELAADWQVEPFDAKARAGQLVLDGNRAEVDTLLAVG